ncbi:helix-turn-helix domain-containing protein [Phenylobacterium sp.]|uniref:helix-turn-helix domain-containing protein n=1 Tax=Phenylobacterium sp. TaxID=1871053 RepID=UPI0035AFDCF9
MEGLQAEAERVRASGVLGRSERLARLFDYLASQAQDGRPVREADIAVEVFGRETELPGDASVRVYVHRLRRKLDDLYAGQVPRLGIPLGEYRLTLETADPRPHRRAVPWRRVAAGLSLLILLAAGGVWAYRATAPTRALDDVAQAPLWRGMGERRPVLVVVGDYYIFGDTEGDDTPQRMIRAFDVNAPGDLEMLLAERPELQGRYVDLDTYYTPVGATLALREILPVARRLAGDPANLALVTSSQLTPEMLKSHDVIYVGYLSGLRLLQEPVFRRSRFEIGETYDELLDRSTGEAFVSGAGPAHPGRPNQDYGYLAAVEGPGGSRWVIVAGGRDIGVMQSAEIAADPARAPQFSGSGAEALYRVEGLGRTNISAAPVPVRP